MSKRKKKSFLKRNFASIIIIALLAAGVLFYINDIEKTEAIEDSINNTSVKHYHILENPNDSLYIANILMENEASILTLSETFYKDKMFWPYIFEVNLQIENVLNLKKGTIVKIPIISSYLLDTKDQRSVDRASFLGDSLLNDVSKKREEYLKADRFNEW